MSVWAGVDIGSSSTKAVLVDEKGEIVASAIRRSGADFEMAATETYEDVLKSAGLTKDDVAFCISTGYGRSNAPFSNGTKTEISCHGKGVYKLIPEAVTIIDIGGQDTKVIRIDKRGKRVDFKMNRKCAAGTGSFLEEIALRLDVPLERMNEVAEKATERVTLNSFCTVFAGTEILARIREGTSVENLARGVYESIISRVLEMDDMQGNVVFTGGVVAHNPILISILRESHGVDATVPPHPQIMGAYGAALFALESRQSP